MGADDARRIRSHNAHSLGAFAVLFGATVAAQREWFRACGCEDEYPQFVADMARLGKRDPDPGGDDGR